MSTHGAGDHYLQAVQGLAAMIGEARDEIERTRLLPAALISALEAAGIFRMWLPSALGGPELSIAEFVRVVEALSYMDGSVGWCAGLGAAYSRFAGYLPEAVAMRIFDGNTVAGSLAPTGRGTKVTGGYRVTGRWAWGSGIMHSNWILVTFLTQGDDGPVIVDGKPEMRLGFLPKLSDVEVIDTWKVGGMRGTGSHDYAVSDAFIPDEYTLEGLDPPPRHPGSLYATSLNSVYPFVIAAIPLGIATAAFDAFLSLAQVKTPVSGSVLLRDKPTVQAMVGRSHALLQGAREFYYATARSMPDWAARGTPLTLDQRAQVRLAVTQIGEASKQVVRNLNDASGGSAVYEMCPLERHFRDIHAVTQHVQVSPNNFEFAGRVILGLEPGTARF
jgi:alkylation response protein AidB-like acyl-CoA dehydrogenase